MTKPHDIIVIGAALNGLAAALALGGNHVKRPLDVVVVDVKDPRAFSTNAFDGRASAITAAARRMFESLGIWDKVAQHAEAMAEIIVARQSRRKKNTTMTARIAPSTIDEIELSYCSRVYFTEVNTRTKWTPG